MQIHLFTICASYSENTIFLIYVYLLLLKNIHNLLKKQAVTQKYVFHIDFTFSW